MATFAARGGPVTVTAVGWDDEAAVALRRAMTEEMDARYADLIAVPGLIPDGMHVEPGTVVYTGVARSARGVPVGHVALRRLGAELELKRMFVTPAERGGGVAQALLAAAEDEARALGASRIVLQTGPRQPDAVRMYLREGYTPSPVFPPYEGLTGSHCFEKAV
ncbi:GNAT family N-acetyltransferase [Streptosporangium sp. NPDC023615]|uniref:GNAT family N-acetyltransferase n=1 Tax=Streptosporangium sp. NPDC023615 TaxID=3154794 RepID=UPI00341D02AC